MQGSGGRKRKGFESRNSDGDGLLVGNGANRANPFSGDTDNGIF